MQEYKGHINIAIYKYPDNRVEETLAIITFFKVGYINLSYIYSIIILCTKLDKG